MTINYLKKTATFCALALAASLGTAPTTAQAGSNPFLGEIVPMGIVGFCPRGFASAEGQILAISSDTALFSLLGTQFGGDGRTTFALPDLRSRVPVGSGTGPGLPAVRVGQAYGSQSTTLQPQNMTRHNHPVNVTNADGDKPGPGGKILAAAPPGGTGAETIYSDQPATVEMSPNSLTSTGGGQAFNHEDPTLVIRYCIAIIGVYPSRS